jgi:hypothetical protein
LNFRWNFTEILLYFDENFAQDSYSPPSQTVSSFFEKWICKRTCERQGTWIKLHVTLQLSLVYAAHEQALCNNVNDMKLVDSTIVILHTAQESTGNRSSKSKIEKETEKILVIDNKSFTLIRFWIEQGRQNYSTRYTWQPNS